MSHGLPEHSSNAPPPPVGSDRAFGFVFAAFFLIVGLMPLLDQQSPRLWSLAAAGITLLIAVTGPKLLSPFNRAWLWFGQLLHRLVSPIALLVIYSLAVVPTGLLVRMLRKDPLRLRFDKGASTYWVDRDPPGRSDQQMKKQF